MICLILYVVMFVTAPFIAGFYGNSSLTSIIRVISLTIVISGVKGIQQSYVSRNMMFKRFFYSTLGGTVFSAFLVLPWLMQGLVFGQSLHSNYLIPRLIL